MTARKVFDEAANRARLIKLIHVAKRKLQMADEAYRAALQRAGGADSTKDMTSAALQRVVDHMKACGFKVRRGVPSPGRRVSTKPDARKVRALWLFLHELGAVRDPSEAALTAYVKRIAKVDDLAWAGGEASHDLIETLKKWAMRYLPQAVAKLRADAIAAQRMDLADVASVYLAQGQGFDKHWLAWQSLQEGLGRLVTPAIKSLGKDDR